MPERVFTLAMLYAAVSLVLIGRLFMLQVVQGDEHAAAVLDSRERVELLPAKRGSLLDRHGNAIVDNRAIYRAAVVFADLELPWRVRRQLPYFQLDEAGFDGFLADLAIRLSRTHEDLRKVVLNEWLADPLVAFRTGAEVRDTELTLIATPPETLLPDQGSAEGIAELATSGLMVADPREALRREVLARWHEACQVFTPEEFTLVTAAIDVTSAMGAARCHTVLSAFSPVVSATLGDGPGQRLLRLHVLTAERREQAESALARFLSLPLAEVHQRVEAAFISTHQRSENWGVYFAPSAQALEVTALLPPMAAIYQVPFAGVPPARERIILLQGDRPGRVGDAFTRTCRRLAATLGVPGDWIAGLVEEHGTRTRIQTAERLYRHKLLALDVDLLDRLTTGLSGRLTAAGLPQSVLELEGQLALMRRIADREWAGQGHHDPLPIVEEIPHTLAKTLNGLGTGVPRDLERRYDGTEPDLPGLRVTIDSGRKYPNGNTLCHLVGALGEVDQRFVRDRALELGLDPEGRLGRSGLEKLYDDHLRGNIGRRIWRHTPDGVELVLERLPEPGHDLTTEIDLEIQQSAEYALDHWFELAGQLNVATEKMDKGRAVGLGRAGMVVIDCNTGAILAIASAPRYRPDELSQRWHDLLKDPHEPLHDFAAEATQPPGSSLKILTALAALEVGVLRPQESIASKGYMAMINGRQALRSHAPAGSYNLIDAIAQSDNVYFATVGQRLGGERMSDYFYQFGVGRNNALDVPQQKPGLLPHPATLGRRWTASDSWRMAIGQFSTVSPLQCVTIAAAVANGGHIVTPYIVRPPGGPTVRDLHVRQEYLEEVRRGMRAVTDGAGGTATYLQLGGDFRDISVAAKTGTSEWGNTDQIRFPDHAQLIGYAPADNPTIAFAIFIHSGTSGGRACSGVAKHVLEAYFAKYGRHGHAWTPR